MPRRKAEPGNPEWIAILQAEKDRIVARDPESTVQYTYVRAINELRNTPDRIDFPGQRTVRYVGAKMIELIKRKLAAGFTMEEEAEDPFAGLDYNNYRAPIPAVPNRFLQGNATVAIPKGFKKDYSTSKSKGKQRARRSPSLYSDEENDHATTSSRYRPAQGSGPHALLVSMYTQCEPNNQRIWLNQHELLNCAAPFSSQDAHQRVGSGGQQLFASVWAGMTILTVKGLVYEDTSVQHIPRYSLSYAGYGVAEACAEQAGIPKLVVTNWTIKDPWRPIAAAPAAPYPALDPASAVAWRNRQMSITLERPADQGSSFLESRKRKISETDAELEKGLVFSWRDVPEPSMPVIPQQAPPNAAVGGGQTLGAKPLARKFANGSFAGVYKAAPSVSAAPVADTMPFLFSYLDANDNRVKTKDEADVQQHEATMSTMYKVEFRSKQARHPLARIILDKKPLIRSIPLDLQECGPTEYGYILAEKALPTCPGLPSSSTAKEKEKEKSKRGSAVDSLMAGGKKASSKDPRAMYKMNGVQLLGSTGSTPSSSSVSSPDLGSLRAKEPTTTVAVHPPPVQRSVSDPSCSSSTTRPRVINALPPFRQTLPTPSTSSPNTFLAAAGDMNRPVGPAAGPSQLSSSSPLKRPSLARSTSSTFSLGYDLDTPFPVFDPVKIPAGSFYIHLYVDHRERKGQAGLEHALIANSMPYLTKALDLGDYVWTAKRRVPQHDSYDEVVIAVCERKRFDDFIQCIKSEIYKNQKRRIKAAGIRKCFYLAEQANIQRSTDYSTFMKAISTCMSETQVVDGFNLHVAMDEQDATNYLVRLTRAFQTVMTTQDLHVIPDARVDGAMIALLQDQLAERQPTICHFTTLAAFERLGKVPHTLKSCWSKMLCSVSGTSEEQCFDILEHYPTPASLIEEMSERLDFVNEQGEIPAYGRKTKKLKESAPEMFLKKKLERGQPRPMTVPLSTRYWELFTSNDYSASNVAE